MGEGITRISIAELQRLASQGRVLGDGAAPRKQEKAASRRAAHVPGTMNSDEKRYADLLEIRRIAGEVRWWKYEAVSIRLAKRTFYRPDFLVQMADGSVEVHEVKGFWEDDARVKIKVAAEMFPLFTFRAMSFKKGTWNEETFG